MAATTPAVPTSAAHPFATLQKPFQTASGRSLGFFSLPELA